MKKYMNVKNYPFRIQIKYALLLIILIKLALTNVSSQIITSKCLLPASLNESSGMTTINSAKTFWLHNDSGAKNELIEVDSNCQYLRTLVISNAQNIDWEGITSDPLGNLYIGDFGNNSNSRTDLAIYIIENISTHTLDTITAKKIQFNYANQRQFPPSDALRNFDAEAFFWYNDSLHIFTKNRTIPFTGYTYQYKIPAKEGSYAVFPSDSVITGTGNMNLNWVTDAAISPLQNKMILLSYDKAFIFYDFPGSQLFKGKRKDILFSHLSQKEGICFGTEHELWISEEGGIQGSAPANLYQFSISNIFTDITHFNSNNNIKKQYVLLSKEELKLYLEKEKFDVISNLLGQKIIASEPFSCGIYIARKGKYIYYLTCY